MTARRRVVHVLNELRHSGAEVMLLSQHDLWAQRGFELTALEKSDSHGVFADQMSAGGIAVEHVAITPRSSLHRRLYDLFRTAAPEVVHIHAEAQSFDVALAARRAGVRRIVRTIHAPYLTSPKAAARIRVQRWALRRIGVRMVAVSDAVAGNELSIFGNPCTVVPNGVDLSRFQPADPTTREALRQELGLPHNSRIVVSVGNCAPAKNHAAILEAVADCADYFYVHVGDEGSDRTERQLAATVGVAHRTRFVGAQDDVLPWLQASDVYVMPSHYEGLGISALEAISAGLPAVLAPVGGLAELAALGSCVSAAQQPQEIARALLDPPSVPDVPVTAAIAHRYSASGSVDAYAAIYS